MMPAETSDIIIKLHDLARELEKGKYDLFGKELRNIADRLSRVSRHYDLTEKEQFVYEYAMSTSGSLIKER